MSTMFRLRRGFSTENHKDLNALIRGPEIGEFDDKLLASCNAAASPRHLYRVQSTEHRVPL